MTTPQITHAFSLEHTDTVDGTKRELGVTLDDLGTTTLCFTTTAKEEAPHETVLPLSEIGFDMLIHAMNILAREKGMEPYQVSALH